VDRLMNIAHRNGKSLLKLAYAMLGSQERTGLRVTCSELEEEQVTAFDKVCKDESLKDI